MRLPVDEYQRSALAKPRQLPKGIDRFVDRCAGMVARRPGVRMGLMREARVVCGEAEQNRQLSDEELKDLLAELKTDFRRGGKVVNARLELRALGAIREAARRTLGLEAYAVQLAGALGLFRGCLVEMATGEGKTLSAALAGVMLGWTGKPCHVITVNDYLAQRDAENMQGLYGFCGVNVAHVVAGMSPDVRRQSYIADVVYCTSKEIVADFLRDRIQMGSLQQGARRHVRFVSNARLLESHGLVMRGLHTAIVDEADSVLVDEAVTPLIIAQSQEVPYLNEASLAARYVADMMVEDVHYRIDDRYREIEMLAAGKDMVSDNLLAFPQVFAGGDRALFFVRQALQAQTLFVERKQYVNDDGKVVIIDEFTGRAMPQRSWSQGLHQAIEAKEGMELTAPSETLARLSFQRFFRFFQKLGGMSGTAMEAADELWEIYRLPVVRIPPNRKCQRVFMGCKTFRSADVKWRSIVAEIVRVHGTGRPILVGTRNVASSELLADLLREEGVSFRLLNAVNHRQEAEIVTEAGQRGNVTIATNMAGRGTDIILGNGVRELGGLHVIATEIHESERIDRQLFGRSGRQGDPGSAIAFVSAEDELLSRHLAGAPVRIAGVRLALILAQRNASALASKRRRSVLRQDTWVADSLSFAGGADAALG